MPWLGWTQFLIPTARILPREGRANKTQGSLSFRNGRACRETREQMHILWWEVQHSKPF